MTCPSKIKFLLNEYEYLNNTQEALVENIYPSGYVCNFLADDLQQNHNQVYFLGTHYLGLFEIADTVAIFGLRDLLEVGGTTQITVLAADDPIFTVNVEEQSFDVAISDLSGFEVKDWFANLSDFSVGKPYWAVRVFTENEVNRPVRRVMIGKSLSLSRNPSYPAQFGISTDYIEGVRGRLQLKLNYLALTSLDKINVIDRLLKNQDFTLGALIDEQNDLLFGNKIMMFILEQSDIKIRESASGIDLILDLMEAL